MLLFLSLVLPLTAQTTIVYVDADTRGGPGARDGSSWEDAYPRLSDALANTTGPAEIWVAEGTYRPSEVLDRADTYTLVDGVDLYGGFNGTETVREEADPEAHPTILTGDLMLDDDSGGSNAENSYHVLHCPSGSLILDGFTIHGGNTTGDASNTNGGGAYGAGSLTVSNCVFRGNRADGPGPADGNGGAVYGNHSFSQCRFEDNFATGDGGAVRAGGASSLNFFDCVFVANESLEDGGGVFWTSGSVAPSFVRCTFDSNQGDRGGGLYVFCGGSALIDQCSFVGNSITPKVSSNDVEGGGLYLWGTDPSLVTDCLFAGNTAVGIGGGVGVPLDTSFINCVFLGNTAEFAGGGLGSNRFSDSTHTLINCTFHGNHATDNEDGGGGVFAGGEGERALVVQNCLFWNNAFAGDTTSPEASIRGSSGLARIGVPVFTNSLVQGWDPPGAGNLDGTDLANDPLFVSPVDPATAPHLTGDLRLLATSPALDAGDNSLISEAFDIDGLPRVQNTTVDMGAYEAIPAAEISVFDGDANELTDNGAALDLGVLRLEDLSTTVDFTIENPSLLSLTGVGVTASGPSAPDVSVSVTPSSTVAPYASTVFQITLTHNTAGSIDATLAVASNDADENPFDIPLVGVIASDMSDGDSDGVNDYQEGLNGTDPGDPDSDGDGVLDGAEIDLAAFGFSEGIDDSALLATLQGSATGLGLFTESNLQALALDRPVISRDAGTGNFTIATGILQSPDLDTTPFTPLIDFTPTYVPGTGELLLEFAPPSPDAHFFQIFGEVPQP
ncbi:MAG: right-handed parallel beta-helix repeat-containing protein [Verrucomicrobiota bacterium]